jgi:hypothetical protein
MRIKAEWFRPGADAPHKTEHVTADETKKRLFVRLPSGYVKRCRKFDHNGTPLSSAIEWAGAPGKSTKLLLTWNPQHYKVK